MIGTSALFVLDGGGAIGIKSRLVEWARLDGRSYVYGGTPGVSRGGGEPDDVTRWRSRCGVSECGCSGCEAKSFVWGSAALGLSEALLPGRRFQALRGTVLQAFVRARSGLWEDVGAG